jgi:hypothetical protein
MSCVPIAEQGPDRDLGYTDDRFIKLVSESHPRRNKNGKSTC